MEVLAEHETFEQANAVMDAQQWVGACGTATATRHPLWSANCGGLQTCSVGCQEGHDLMMCGNDLGF